MIRDYPDLLGTSEQEQEEDEGLENHQAAPVHPAQPPTPTSGFPHLNTSLPTEPTASWSLKVEPIGLSEGRALHSTSLVLPNPSLLENLERED